jgi:DNA-directed RNA polymerase specialized sigma24 family protein
VSHWRSGAVLETLRPSERTVFVLREVFDVPYGQITGIYAIATRAS